MFDSRLRSLYVYVLSLFGIALFAPTFGWLWIVTYSFLGGMILPRVFDHTVRPAHPTPLLPRMILVILAVLGTVMVTMLPNLPGIIPGLVPQAVQSQTFYHVFSIVELVMAFVVIVGQFIAGKCDVAFGTSPFLSRIKGLVALVFLSMIPTSIFRMYLAANNPHAQQTVALWILVFLLIFLPLCRIFRRQLREDLRRS